MSLTRVGYGSVESASVLRRGAAIGRRPRVVVPVCLVLICGSFACAAVLQMRFERTRALSEAAEFGRIRSEQMAADLGQTLDRYAAIANAFMAAKSGPETSAALAAAGGAPLLDVAEIERTGRLGSEMTGALERFPPFSPFQVAQARRRSRLVSSPDGQTFALLFPRADAVLSMEIGSSRLLSPSTAADGVIATLSGRLLALGKDWRNVPPADALRLGGAHSLSRTVEGAQGARLVSLTRVAGWPLVAGTSIRVAKAVDLRSGSLPLYLFLIIGPAFAGAALAVFFAPLFERHAKRAAATKSLRVTRPAEARLLVRLAHAERRASEAEDAKSRFVSQVSHELRTPLNAIIGFAEAIESDVFGAPGHPKYSEYARDIGAAGRELHVKIGAVLEFAALGKASNPEVGGNAPASDVAAAARSQVESRRPAALARGVDLEMALPGEARARVDPESLNGILAHLLDNAIAYTPKGGSVRVEVSAGPRDIVVAICDTGAGFTSAEREQAGRPFQRFARAGAQGGMGVGLAIAMALARRAGATLNLASIPGEGTRAELRMPSPT